MNITSSNKRARRQYLKSIQNRQPDPDWTPFRAAEKFYKAKFPPPDLTNVLDFAAIHKESMVELGRGAWMGSAHCTMYRETQLKTQAAKGDDVSKRKAYIIPQIPGLVVLPSFLSPAKQRELISWSLREHARHPNETNLDTHYTLPSDGIWNSHLAEDPIIHTRQPLREDEAAPIPGPRHLVCNTPASPSTFLALSSQPKPPSAPSATLTPTRASGLLPKLRWANIGWYYHWGTKQYDFFREKVDVAECLKDVCTDAVRSVDWDEVFNSDHSRDGWEGDADWSTWTDSYDPDAGIVNFYQLKDTLMAHVDRSEVCSTSPLVSISLGNAAIFLIGGHTRRDKPLPILLRSGDVLIMSGPRCRRAYHGVPRILEGSLPAYLELGALDTDTKDWAPFAQYLRTSRININVRQVFPKDFDPHMAIDATIT